MKKLILFTWLVSAGLMTNAQSTWSFDQAHTNVSFNVEHLVISEVTGHFGAFEGEVVASNEDFSGSKVNFSVGVASVDTDNERRDNHLKSDDFFNAEKYPNISFTNGKLEQVDGKMYKLTGDLTIRDVTRQVELDAKYGGTIIDNRGNTKAGFKITGKINRFDYNVKFDAAMEAGGLVVGEDVEIVCNVELQKNS